MKQSWQPKWRIRWPEIDGDGVAGPRARLEAVAVRLAPIPCLLRRRVGWARRFRGARSPYGALLQGLRSGPGRWLHARARVEGGGRRAPVRARGPPRGGCWRFWRPALMVRGARAWPRGAARRVCAGIAKLVRTLGCACACGWPWAAGACGMRVRRRAHALGTPSYAHERRAHGRVRRVLARCVCTPSTAKCGQASDAGIACCQDRMLQEPWPWFS